MKKLISGIASLTLILSMFAIPHAKVLAADTCSDITLMSGTLTQFKGLTTIDPGSSSVDGLFTGGTPGAAVVATPTGFPGAWDTASADPDVAGASWVNNSTDQPNNPADGNPGGDGNVDTWRLFSDSFTIPAGATSISSPVLHFTSDNSVEAFLDGVSIGTAPSYTSVTDSSPLVITTGAHEFEFVVKNDAYDGPDNPTGLLYKVTINYCVPSTPTLVKVTIDKYIDGEMATAGSADNSAFPMSASWDATNIGAGSGNYDLDADGFNGNPTPYQAITSDMTAGADYSTYEITGGSVVGASCADGKPYALVGYTSGDTLEAAEAASPSLTVPSFTDLQTDKFVIVWNKSCQSEIHGSKFWDVNGNGVWENGEPALPGWTINLGGDATDSEVTDGTGDYGFTNLAAGNYTLAETLKSGWTQTVAPGPVALTPGQVLNNQDFGNSCFVGTGGKSKGYWTNKNGETTMNDGTTSAPELAMLSALNLRNANGSNFDPGTYASYKTWNTNANATNMAYMLSAQLSAVELSVEAGFASGTALIVAPDLIPYPISGVSALGLISINDLMTAANSALGVDGFTPSGDPNRPYQEALKNVLDRVANGQSIQVCNVSLTFTASDSSYYNGPTDASPLYGSGAFSVTWNPFTGIVTGGYYNEVVPAGVGTTYYNIIGGTVSGNVFTLNFTRTNPNVYAFNGTVTLSGNTMSGTLDGPYYFTATGTVTP